MKCKVFDTIPWSDVDRDLVAPYGWDWDSVSQCQDQSVTNQMGAFTTAATLIFAMNGCLTRIRTVADTNFQSRSPTFGVQNPTLPTSEGHTPTYPRA